MFQGDKSSGCIRVPVGVFLRLDDSLVQHRCPRQLPGLAGLVDELWHQGQRERGAGLSCVLPPRRVSFVLPVVLLHDHLLEHTSGHLALHLVTAQRRRPVFRDEQLESGRLGALEVRLLQIRCFD